jgi:hypothetical protein
MPIWTRGTLDKGSCVHITTWHDSANCMLFVDEDTRQICFSDFSGHMYRGEYNGWRVFVWRMVYCKVLCFCWLFKQIQSIYNIQLNGFMYVSILKGVSVKWTTTSTMVSILDYLYKLWGQIRCEMSVCWSHHVKVTGDSGDLGNAQCL